MRRPEGRGVEPSEVDALLGPEGPLSRSFSGYEHRPEQLVLSRAVAQAFKEHSYLLAEAGTGTGKTLAYLVPAVLSGRKTVVSTATKNLQDQLFFKDLALLRDKLGLEFDAAYVKGRGNYLCLHRFDTFARAPEFVSREEAALWPMIQAWAETTEQGDRNEVALPDQFSAWRQLSSTSETCLGQGCPQFDNCFVTKMRKRADDASLVIANHHLFFADLALRKGRSEGQGVLPRYEAVIFDEAHAIEDAATQFFGSSVSSFKFEDLATDAQSALPLTDTRAGLLAAHAHKVKAEAEALFRLAPRVVGMGAGGGTVRLTPQSLKPLQRELEQVVHGLAALASLAAGEEEPELATVARRSSELANQLEFIQKAESLDHVYWAEGRGRGVHLHAAPIEVREELRTRLYPNVDTVVFTSATLRAGQSFAFAVERLGLRDDGTGEPVVPFTELAVPSSFNYAEQAALYLPRHLPDPQEPGFVEDVVEEVLKLVELTDGRAFVLFTSLRNLQQAAELARPRLPYPVLVQGERPKAALLEDFKTRPSVLFASQSFWEGVDVPGDALSLVIMDKLPFASPGEPVVSARIERLRERGVEPFSAYQVPDAAISLRQGFGRLIRTRQDRGVVAILDKRIVTKGYGRHFIQGLPRVNRFSELDPLRVWWEEHR